MLGGRVGGVARRRRWSQDCELMSDLAVSMSRTAARRAPVATDAAPVTPSVLRWARESVGASVDEAARRAGVSGDRILAWEDGAAEPTLAKLRALAKLYQRPISVFFLDEPPREFDAMHDFRRLPDMDSESWSRALHKVYRRALEQQEVMQELLRSDGEPLDARVPHASVDEDADVVGARARAALQVELKTQFAWRDPDTALKGWVEALERVGILVLRTSEVPTREMRGFSIPGDVPVLVINALDPPRAQAFTALHEFTHLMLHVEGLCDLVGATTGDSAVIEPWCNAVAAAAFMPRDEFLQGLGGEAVFKPSWDEEVIGQLSDRWSVSREVVVRRLLTLGLTSQDFYRAKRDEYQVAYAAWREEQRIQRRSNKGGPPPYRMAVRDRGRPYVRMILDAYHRNELSAASLSRLLSLRTRHIAALANEVQQ